MIIYWNSIREIIFIRIIKKKIDFSVVIAPISMIGAATIIVIFP